MSGDFFCFIFAPYNNKLKKYMMNQTLIFNTTERTAVLKEYWNASEEITTYDNVPTVKIENGYYEVMQKLPNDRLLPIAPVVPVLRVPIANTNMIIKK